jgi:hypothetical protein
MRIPKGKHALSSYVSADLHARVRVEGFKGAKPMHAVLEEALTAWVERQEQARGLDRP